MDNVIILFTDQKDAYREALKDAYPLAARLVLLIVELEDLFFESLGLEAQRH